MIPLTCLIIMLILLYLEKTTNNESKRKKYPYGRTRKTQSSAFVK